MSAQSLTLQKRLERLMMYLEQPEWDPERHRWATTGGGPRPRARARRGRTTAASDAKREAANLPA